MKIIIRDDYERAEDFISFLQEYMTMTVKKGPEQEAGVYDDGELLTNSKRILAQLYDAFVTDDGAYAEEINEFLWSGL